MQPAFANTAADTLDQVAPALVHYTRTALLDGVWRRPGLSRRDRSLVSLSALIARDQTAGLPLHFRLALDHGLTPDELAETMLQLAFYSGWQNALDAAHAAVPVFAERGIVIDPQATIEPALLPLDEAAEAQRAANVEDLFGAVSPGLVQNTTELLFGDLWRRPGLAPRDRSLVTVAALVATGQVAQATFHLNRALDNGLTQAEAGEVLTQLAFYTGWPRVFSALPVFRQVFEQRAASQR